MVWLIYFGKCLLFENLSWNQIFVIFILNRHEFQSCSCEEVFRLDPIKWLSLRQNCHGEIVKV